MTRHLSAAIALALPLPALTQPARATPPVAFTGVTVIPMDRERTLVDHTVVVRDGRITALGPRASVAVPRDAQVIPGDGRFLIPGLADMHAHLLSDAAVPDSLAADEFMMMLANGLTSVRLMIGTPEHLAWRQQIEAGTLVGPRLLLASPQLAGRSFGDPFNGYVANTPDAARHAVRAAKRDGYDFVKITFFITRPVYEAIVDEARVQGMTVVGHVDPQVGLARVLEARQAIEHLDGYLEALVDSTSPVKGSVSGVQVWNPKQWASLDHLDTTRIPALARATVAAGGWATPTMTFLESAFGTGQSDEEIRRRPDWSFFPEALRAEMDGPRQRFWSNPPSEAQRASFVRAKRQLTRAIHEAGGRILAGSDAPEWYLHNGFTLHRELERLVAAGLSPFAALAAATRNPQEFFAAVRRSPVDAGTIAVGQRADLVLLDANPLLDIRHTTRIRGVMAQGRWFDRSQLDTGLQRAARRLGAGPD